jgi:hypothetical protein
MLRFPARFTADLTKVLLSQKLFGSAKPPVVLRLNPVEWAARVDVLPVSPSSDSNGSSVESSSIVEANQQMLSFIRRSNAPVVWIGGETPLQYPHIGQLTRGIVKMGRTVFVEKDGRLLRRRIHEFRPVSRLYVTVELNGLEDSHDLRAGHAGLFRHTLEGVRAAKLSGFLICVQTKIFEDTELSALSLLAKQITKMGADSWVVTRANDNGSLPDGKIEAARNLIPSRRWRWFSGLLDRSIAPASVTIGETQTRTTLEARDREEPVAGLRTQ